ncbi:hypothetical protein A3D77_00275 [Candidatus Gottesmanbacteria bacterium RIFCSPHIGHO2_02_FULL_39_11]|uniref:Methyltransferase type 11 domain-containing protein n=1 Tax=Candidatus Gottesmanbacteria bacterium RIFCSPHIGHO2_02_FULL_39_11 TaxID=1798382 RepID=A0A1F5ZXT9_9BACT|nr:MAG: hypothetical protein A3D77_00275 [Candidatus Gottesmanbacteria bacterium RIFCSPHIGHO2_02_FULL_39_11]
MDTTYESPSKRGYGLDQVRGIMTNRGIQREVKSDRRIIGGVFDYLGLSINELQGKKLLDVGTGGGKTVEESRELGLDITGVDIAPVISLKGEDEFSKQMVTDVQKELREVTRKYPNSVVGADATVALPFMDSSFDIVISHCALPGYARNPKELAVSILEMIRVAKERVVITGKNFSGRDMEGLDEFGTGRMGVPNSI